MGEQTTVQAELAQRPPVAELGFEAAQAELEQVVERLEDRHTGLEDALALWERGEALHRHCAARLQAAGERIEKLTLDQDAVAAVEAEGADGGRLAEQSRQGAAGSGEVPPSTPDDAGGPPSMF